MSSRRIVQALVAGYLLGSFPSADLVAKRATRGAVDLRAVGSGNPGAMNAAKQLGTRWGLVVLGLDAAKGALAGGVGGTIGGSGGAYAAATASIAGHIAPPWSGFRGGKGVATSAGACAAVFPAYFPIDAAVAALGAAGSRNAETSVRVSAVAWVGAALVWWRHGLPNAWGPEPTVGLPLFAASSSALILAKFAVSRRTAARAAAPSEHV
jgi:glycerol-3-phosphate acyltransferase PlsY